MKNYLLILLILGGCITVQNPLPPTYTPPIYVTKNSSEDTLPIPDKHTFIEHYDSITSMGADIARNTLQSPKIKDYLKKNPKAWLAVKYSPTTFSSIEESICYNHIPTRLTTQNPLKEADMLRWPKGYTCVPNYTGMRSIIEAQFMNYGLKRVVIGGRDTRKILSRERNFQMKHASTRTIHPPGHVAGSSLLMILSVYSPDHPGVISTYNVDTQHQGYSYMGLEPGEFKTVVQVKIVRVKNDEVMFDKIYILNPITGRERVIRSIHN